MLGTLRLIDVVIIIARHGTRHDVSVTPYSLTADLLHVVLEAEGVVQEGEGGVDVDEGRVDVDGGARDLELAEVGVEVGFATSVGLCPKLGYQSAVD